MLTQKTETNSAIRALEMMEAIGKSGSIGHSALSELLDIPKSTTSSILKSLLASGYVFRQADKRYCLTARVMQLAESYVEHRQWLAPLLPLLDGLKDATGESSFLVQREGGDRVVIARRLVSEGLSYTVPVGNVAPLAGTAGGHALIGEDEVLLDPQGAPERAVISDAGVYSLPSAIVSGVMSFAIPIPVPRGVGPLAFSLAMPEARLSAAARERIEAALVAARDAAGEVGSGRPLTGRSLTGRPRNP